jgi:hypothetical protein
MSRILKRPMFRRGGKVNQGIMSGLVDRTKLANGTDIGNMTEDEFRANLKNLMSIQDQFTPLPKTRIPLGEIGLALASGAPVTDALFTGYKKFVSDDDKIRALRDKRKSAAVSTVLGQAFKDKKQKDTRTNEMKMLEEVYGKDSPQYKKALEAIVLKDVLPKSGFRLLSGDEIKQLIERGVNLDPNKPYQINTDQTSKDFNKISVVGGSGMTIQNILGDQKAAKQASGQLTSEAAINKAISNVSFVEEIGKNIDIVDKMLKENPTIGGTSGAVLRFGNKAVSAAKNFGMGEYAEGFLEKFGAKDLVLDDDIATLNALEDAIAPAYARILFPDAKTITNKMIDIARENIGLTTGFTGADEVRGRLAEISRQFDNYIKNQNILIKGPEEKVGDFTKGEDGIYRLK